MCLIPKVPRISYQRSFDMNSSSVPDIPSLPHRNWDFIPIPPTGVFAMEMSFLSKSPSLSQRIAIPYRGVQALCVRMGFHTGAFPHRNRSFVPEALRIEIGFMPGSFIPEAFRIEIGFIPECPIPPHRNKSFIPEAGPHRNMSSTSKPFMRHPGMKFMFIPRLSSSLQRYRSFIPGTQRRETHFLTEDL